MTSAIAKQYAEPKCPSWCTVSRDHHEDETTNWSASWYFHRGILLETEWALVQLQYCQLFEPDESPDEPASVYVDILQDDGLTPDELTTLQAALATAARRLKADL